VTSVETLLIDECVGPEHEVLPAAERWEHAAKGRYYTTCVQRNLFGDLEVWRAWGGIGSRRGGQLCDPVVDAAAASARLATINQRRQARGYSNLEIKLA
jgi:predicted DNA-binding WGR domain protein